MTVPAVAFIEMAVAQVSAPVDATAADGRARTLKEFHGLGQARLAPLHGIAATDLERGYLLGLETARVLLSTMPAAQMAGVEL